MNLAQRLVGGRRRITLRFNGHPRELYVRRWSSTVDLYRGPYRSPGAKTTEYAERSHWADRLRENLLKVHYAPPDLLGPLRVQADFLMPKPKKAKSGRPASGKAAGKPLKDLVRALVWVLDAFPLWDPSKAEVATFSASKAWETPGEGGHRAGLRLTILELEPRKRPQKPRVAARMSRRASRSPR